MSEFREWFAAGGPVMTVLGALALVLGFLIVERYIAIGARLRSVHTSLDQPDGPVELSGLRKGPCVVTAHFPEGRRRANVAVTGPRTYVCFEGGRATCE